MDESETYAEDVPTQPEAPSPPRAIEVIAPQESFDQELLAQSLATHRASVAAGKLNYHMARAGVPGVEGHPRQHLTALRNAERGLAVIEELARGDGLTSPSELLEGIDDETVRAVVIPGGGDVA